MKYKGIEILPKPWWMYIYLPRARGATGFGKIYFKKYIYDEIANNKMSPITRSLLEHEVTHIKRFEKIGQRKIEVLYWLDKNLRYKEELAAIRSETKVLKRHKQKFDFKQRIKALSGFGYLWCTDYKTAKRDLKNIWNSV